MAADLITLDRLLDALNKVLVDLEPQEVDKYNGAIKSASAAVRAYTDRDFTLNTSAVASPRNFEYDDSGFIDIDDAQSVTAVQIVFPYGGAPVALTTTQWARYPQSSRHPVFDSLLIYSPMFYGMSREMGFTYNLDRFEGPMGPPPTVAVTGVWGWPEIPEDVQQATVWTAAAFAEDARQVTSESIDSFSRSMNVVQPSAIPLRARELLDEYRRIVV
jgi:hypothetical protein